MVCKKGWYYSKLTNYLKKIKECHHKNADKQKEYYDKNKEIIENAEEIAIEI